MKYDYLKELTMEIVDRIEDRFDSEEISDLIASGLLEDEINDLDYGVTGYGYGFRLESEKTAKQCLAENEALLSEALKDLDHDANIETVLADPCYCDTLVRRHLFDEAAAEAAEMLEDWYSVEDED